MYRISKDFHFSASHQLHGLRAGHPCGRMHGHNYIVKVTLSGQTLDDRGFLLDYNDLKPFGQWLDDTLDHQHLNEVLQVQPTAENMAQVLAEIARDILAIPDHVSISIGVSETPKTWAEWSN
ncbi:MAG TPA: 6-carboxytetrahydropterin synthase QueD [Acidimicrobiia bacterium]